MQPHRAAARGIGRTFQNIALFRGMTVLDNVMTGRTLKRRAGFFAQALRLRPDYPEVASNLGLALHDLGRFAEAIAQFDAALEMRPGVAVVQNNRGASLFELRRISDARGVSRRPAPRGSVTRPSRHRPETQPERTRRGAARAPLAPESTTACSVGLPVMKYRSSWVS